ncbi:hypothetical protein L2E82_37222 [Cichorium intybus]|uniref:Uncharacterized protein n=1 Tax=Cichorium intybus TaxID=13427 RepID=A0ACB9AEH9_CICIN|nr:hypothetical protein L2E82_37222 [Cichorium intybus]
MVTPSTPTSDDCRPKTSRDINHHPPSRGRGRNTHPGQFNHGGRGFYGCGRPYQPQQPATTTSYAGISYPLGLGGLLHPVLTLRPNNRHGKIIPSTLLVRTASNSPCCLLPDTAGGPIP